MANQDTSHLCHLDKGTQKMDTLCSPSVALPYTAHVHMPIVKKCTCPQQVSVILYIRTYIITCALHTVQVYVHIMHLQTHNLV